MSRINKISLSYFPLDVDFFDDDKIQLVKARFGCTGEIIAVKLLCKIYKTNGYYYQWGEDEALLFAKAIGDGTNPDFVNDVVIELVKRDFFADSVFNKYRILTSNGIQARFISISKQLKRAVAIDSIIDCSKVKKELSGIFPESSGNILGKDGETPEEIEIFMKNSGEREVKEKKENEIESNEKNTAPVALGVFDEKSVEVPKDIKGKKTAVTEKKEDKPVILPWTSQAFIQQWAEWKEHRVKERKGGTYKTSLGENAALAELKELSTDSEAIAIKIIKKSMANGWKGFFALPAEHYIAQSKTHENDGRLKSSLFVNNPKPSDFEAADRAAAERRRLKAEKLAQLELNKKQNNNDGKAIN